MIELLVCIAIIGVLASLLLPYTKRHLDGAHRAGCSNQLRQLYTALASYASDHNSEFIPAYDETLPGPDRTWFYKTSPFAEYLGGAASMQKATVCPALRSKAPLGTVNGIQINNDYGHPYVVNYNVMRSNGTDKRIRMGSIINPSNVVLMADSDKNSAWGFGFADTRFSSFTRIGEPHSGTTSILWCDGHVSSEKKAALTNKELYPDGSFQ